jgi:hypothetical protein
MMVDAALLSNRRVSSFNDAERLLLWALRHRVATGDPASPSLTNAFDLLCGDVTGPRALEALNRLVVAFETHARRPLAFLDWCNRAVTTDEADALDACAALQAGLPTRQRLLRLVDRDGVVATGAAVATFVAHLREAGLVLPPPDVSSPTLGEHAYAFTARTYH